MNRFHFISFALHLIVFAAIMVASRETLKPLPTFEVYKVSIAPLPQPVVVSEEPPVIEEHKEEIKKEPTKEKAPPKTEEKKQQQEKKTPPKTEPTKKKGLPDIKPQIYTGSGRGFTYSYYLNILLNKISSHWQNPFKGKDIVLKSIVYFEIDKNGTIYNVRLEERSGNELYNESTIRAITSTKKLPPLPDEFSDDYLKVHLEFLSAQ
jgi:TonB family protein